MSYFKSKPSLRTVLSVLFFTLVIIVSFLDLKLVPGKYFLSETSALTYIRDTLMCFGNENFLPNVYDNVIHCKGKVGRPWLYLPMMIPIFKWTMLFDDVTLMQNIYRLLSIMAIVGCWFIWIKNKRSVFSIIFLIITLLQFPHMLGISKSSNDIIAVVCLSLVYLCYSRKEYKFSGFFMGLSIFTKIYPGFSLIFLTIGPIIKFFRKDNKEKSLIKNNKYISFSIGVFVVLISQFLFLDLWTYYLVKIVPNAAFRSFPFTPFTHSILSFKSSLVTIGFFLISVILMGRLYLSNNINRVKLVFCASMALYVFPQGLSVDYNLIAIYPLIWIAFEELEWRSSTKDLLILSLFCFSVFGARALAYYFPSLLGMRTGLMVVATWLAIYRLGDNNKSYI